MCKIFRIHIYVMFVFLCNGAAVYSQDSTTLPRADIQIGISPVYGSYIGTTWQVTEKVYLKASYGKSMGLFVLSPGEDRNIISLGADYDFKYFFLNFTYTYHEETGNYFSHIASVNVEFFSLYSPGFHIIAGVGGFYELGKYHTNESKKGGVNFNIAVGFRIL